MAALAEFFLELVLEGAIGAAGSRRVPLPVRILAACVAGLFLFGTAGLVLWCGLCTRNLPLAGLGGALFFCMCWLFGRAYRANAAQRKARRAMLQKGKKSAPAQKSTGFGQPL